MSTPDDPAMGSHPSSQPATENVPRLIAEASDYINSATERAPVTAPAEGAGNRRGDKAPSKAKTLQQNKTKQQRETSKSGAFLKANRSGEPASPVSMPVQSEGFQAEPPLQLGPERESAQPSGPVMSQQPSENQGSEGNQAVLPAEPEVDSEADWEDLERNSKAAGKKVRKEQRPQVHPPKRGTKRGKSDSGSEHSTGSVRPVVQKNKRVRKNAKQLQVTRPKLSRDVPKEQRASDQELLGIAKRTLSYDRHKAAPYAFDYRGHLYKEYSYLADAIHKSGQPALTSQEAKRVIDQTPASVRYREDPLLFNSKGELRRRAVKKYHDSRDELGAYVSPVFDPEARKATEMGLMQVVTQGMTAHSLDPDKGAQPKRVRDERRELDEAKVNITMERAGLMASREQLRKDFLQLRSQYRREARAKDELIAGLRETFHDLMKSRSVRDKTLGQAMQRIRRERETARGRVKELEEQVANMQTTQYSALTTPYNP
ncbi:MAG: hypothetical protein M4579_007212 [Chaenotheca gracillima]|nr:MAG: hypothetical protein M4579_007212 [Chaenotheca gracillima]